MTNKKSGQQKKQQAKRERRSAQRKERAKKITAQERDKRTLAVKHQRRAEFPDFVFLEEDGNPKFVDIVKKAIQRFDFAELNEIEQKAFRRMKQKGAAYAEAALKDDMRQAREEGANDIYAVSGDLQWLCSVGRVIFSHIDDDDKRSFLPMNDVQFLYLDDVIVAKFRSQLTQKSPDWGTTYYSRYKPTVDFDGEKYVVGFSTEALKRTCERTMKDPLRYDALGDVYAYFEDCQYFEPCTLRDGSHAFSFFDECSDLSPQVASSQRLLSKKILGIKEVDPVEGKLYYRVGYCPVALDKGFAKAKTLLFPGFKKTPEYEMLDKAYMPPDMKRRLQRLATNSDMSSLWEAGDVSALKWFHDNGVTQVRQTTEPLYRGDT